MSNATPYRISPIGTAIHPWITKPDVKYNADGIFKTGLALEGAEAANLKKELAADAEAAFEKEMAAFKTDGKTPKYTAADKKKWTVYYPFEDETDPDSGEPTGRTVFQFKQNAKIRLTDGSVKNFVVGVRDSKDKAVSGVTVWDGTTLRVLYKPRAIVMTGLKQVGVRLDFAKVQIIKLAQGSGGGGGGFGEVEDGFVAGDQKAAHNDEGSEDAEY